LNIFDWMIRFSFFLIQIRQASRENFENVHSVAWWYFFHDFFTNLKFLSWNLSLSSCLQIVISSSPNLVSQFQVYFNRLWEDPVRLQLLTYMSWMSIYYFEWIYITVFDLFIFTW
jgi:hypothetical protein